MTYRLSFAAQRVRGVCLALLSTVAAVWLVMRFVRLNDSPPAFWLDEAWDAAQALCLAERGRDVNGSGWQLFSKAMGGGSLPITWTLFDVLWIRVFGTSQGAFRAAAAFWNVVTCLGLFGLARAVRRLPAPATNAGRADGDANAGPVAARLFPYLVVCAALLSPWSFQFSRIGWEGPLAPAWMVLSLWTLARLWHARGRAWWLWGVASGAAAALSMISYPPLRVATPLVVAMAAAAMTAATPRGADRRRFVVRLASVAVTLGAGMAAVVVKTLSGETVSRVMNVAVFTPEWLDQHRGNMGRLPFLIMTVADNLVTHLRPSYLFFTGDANTRHSAQIVGQLSPVDDLAIVLATAVVVGLALRVVRQIAGTAPPAWPRLDAQLKCLAAVAVLSVAAMFLATLPAALTWEGIPHALRSIGAWPFVVLFSGAVLAAGWAARRWVPVVTVVVAVIYSAVYLPGYFRFYRTIDPDVFHRDITEAIAAGAAAHPPRTAAESIRPLLPRYGDEALRYFLMHHDHLSCQASGDLLHRMRSGR
ncbi:MAG: hypothetical protein ABUS79_09865 [Pseudomonadota bacterium]